MPGFAAALTCLVLLSILVGACGGSGGTPAETTPAGTTATTTLQTTTTSTTLTSSVTATTSTAGEVELPEEVLVSAHMAEMFADLVLIDDYYTECMNGMSTTVVAAPGIHSMAVFTASQGSVANVPPEFMDKLPPDGRIPAPPGACPAAAEPGSAFVTDAGDTVTPDLMERKNIRLLPTDMILAPHSSPGSLMSYLSGLVPRGDQRLADPAYWNTTVWSQVSSLMVPAESLMDYLMWNNAGELEQTVIEQFRQSLAASGVPDVVLNAFDSSSKNGWYTSAVPGPGDALAKMDIIAELTGSVSGTVHETRDFMIPGLGQAPVWGVQTGEGTVSFELPEIGTVYSDVEIYLDEYDEQGRAVGGYVRSIPAEEDGIEVIFTYKPDGTKEGRVLKDGEVIGHLTMTVDHEKFENYVSIKEGTEFKLPESGRKEGIHSSSLLFCVDAVSAASPTSGPGRTPARPAAPWQ